MRAIVVDASVAVQWLVDEEFSTQAAQLLFGGTRLIAPGLIFAEVANALWKMQRRREFEVEQMKRAMNTFRFSAILIPTSMQELSASAIKIAAEIDHAVYDCYYLALALRKYCRVVTADRRFLNKIRGRAEWANYIVHVSEATMGPGQESITGNVIHDPMAMPHASDEYLERANAPSGR